CGRGNFPGHVGRKKEGTKKAFRMESLSLAGIQRMPQPDSNPRDRNPTQPYKDRKAFGFMGIPYGFLMGNRITGSLSPCDHLKAGIPVISAPVIKRWISWVPS